MLCWWMTAQRAVRSLGVIALPPVLDDPPGVGQAAKPMDVQAFVAKFAIEALEVAVLHRLAWIDEIEGHMMVICPGIEYLASELGTVVQRDPFGYAVPQNEVLQEPHDALTWQ
jgi:hypothetical protein